MFGLLNNVPIKSKLPLTVCLLVVLAVTLPATQSYFDQKAALEEHLDARFDDSLAQNKLMIEGLLAQIDRDLAVQAANPTTVAAVQEFTEAFQGFAQPQRDLQRAYITDNPHPLGEKDALNAAPNGTVYDQIHARYHPFFNRLQDEMGYYDVFLFDLEGNLVYSVFKENDYATNMTTGEYASSGLGTAFRLGADIAAEGRSAFVDFAPYAPSYGAPAAFISRSIFEGQGRRVGVLVYQMPIDELNGAVQGGASLGATDESFLVGTDGFLRTDAELSKDSDILKTRFDLTVIAGDGAVLEFTDWRGAEVSAKAAEIGFLGTRWQLVLKQNRDELYAPLAVVLRKSIIEVAGTMVIAMIVAFSVSQTITRPLARLNATVRRVAGGDYDVDIPDSVRRDEVGQIAQALESFCKDLKASEANAQEASYRRAAFDVARSAMVLTDAEGTIVACNAAMAALAREWEDEFVAGAPGFVPGDVIGRRMDMFHPDPDGLRARIAAPENLPLAEQVKLGEIYLNHFVEAVRDSEGGIIGYVVEWQDDTFNARTQSIVNALNSGQAMLMMNSEGRITSANDVFCRLVGKSQDAVIQADGKILIQFEDPASDIWSEVAGGRSKFGAFTLETETGEKVIDGTMGQVQFSEGSMDGYLLMGVDVTETRASMARAEAAQKQMVAEQNTLVEVLRSGLTQLAEGDLTVNIETEFSPDYEVLRSDFNRAIAQIQDAISQIVSGSSTIHSDTSGISSAISDLSQRTEGQAANLQQTSTALNSLTELVKSAATNATTAARVVEGARSSADESGGVVREAISAMREIEESSAEISKITGIIEEIAFQTNLLALNAGVEAARAGEFGRGFAVVASEVRGLAQRSSDAVAEITSLIAASEQQVRHGAKLVDQTGDALTQLVASISDVARHMDEIAEASQHQSSGLEEINTAIGALDKATQSNAAMAEQSNAAIQSLSHETDTLKQIAERFEIDADAVTEAGVTEITPAELRQAS